MGWDVDNAAGAEPDETEISAVRLRSRYGYEPRHAGRSISVTPASWVTCAALARGIHLTPACEVHMSNGSQKPQALRRALTATP